MTTSTIDTNQPTKVSRFARIWPILLSGLVLIFPFIFCGINFYVLFKSRRGLDFAVLSQHSDLMAFLKVEVFPLERAGVGVIIWILTGTVFTIITRSILGKIAILFSFTAVIGIMFTGYFLGLLVHFIPINSLIVESRSFNLGYFYSDFREYYLYECDPQGTDCKQLWSQTGSTYDYSYHDESRDSLVFDAVNRQVKIFIDGQLVYTHPIE